MIALAKKDPRVDMFVWFIFRDDETSVWQSGLLTKGGAAKPALARFRSAAKSVDARNPLLKVRGGIANPAVGVPLRELAANIRFGDTVGINYRVFLRGRQVAAGQPATRLGPDAVARFRLAGFRPAKKTTYVVRLDANTANGGPGLARADDRRLVAWNAALIPRSRIAG